MHRHITYVCDMREKCYITIEIKMSDIMQRATTTSDNNTRTTKRKNINK